jgi:hypothetical protein
VTQAESLSTSTTEWLSLIRYQLITATEQSRLARPLSSLAMSTMQDAVESALVLVIQEKGGEVKSKPDFAQLFDAAIIHGDADNLKVFRHAMLAMNTARVTFKHHGNPLADSAIQRHLSRSEDFLSALVSDVFAVDIYSVSVLTFIRLDEAREKLVRSEELRSSGRMMEALTEVRLAFDLIVRDYTERKQGYLGRSIFVTKPSFYPGWSSIRKSGLDKIDEWLNNLDKWVRFSALGIDLPRYAYFNAHAPKVTYLASGDHVVDERNDVPITEEVYARCLRFVVDTGLSLAQDDFDFDPYKEDTGGSGTGSG